MEKRILLVAFCVSLCIPAISLDGMTSLPEQKNTGGTCPISIHAWSVSYQDVPSAKSLDPAAAWKPVELPFSIRFNDAPPSKLRYIWLRGTFPINDRPETYAGISLGRVYHSDMVMINGSPIGGKSSRDFFELHYPRNYSIPHGLLKKGMNEVLIRVGVFNDQFSVVSSKIDILPGNEFENKLAMDNFVFLLLPFGFLTLYMGFAVLLFLLFIFTRIERKLIYSSIGLSFYIIFILILFFPYQSSVFTVPMEIQLSIQMVTLRMLIPSFIIILILIVQSFYRVRLDHYNRIAILLALITSALAIANMLIYPNPFRRISGIFLMWLMIIAGLVYLGFLAYKLNSMQPDRLKNIMVVVMLVLAGITIIYSEASYLTGWSDYGMFAVFTSPIIIAIFLMLFTKDYMVEKIEMGILYGKLKNPGFNKNSADDRPAITESSEEKLKRIIVFIEENYTSDISREGLAAAVDMNPNYMSRIFMTYTGKKINDYINELRVKQSIKNIEEGRMLILDIALESGFESLSTFNRAFKKVTGTTPTEFKKHK